AQARCRSAGFDSCLCRTIKSRIPGTPAVSDRRTEVNLRPYPPRPKPGWITVSPRLGAQARNFQADARPHGGAERRLLHINALRARRLGLQNRVEERPRVLDQGFLRKGGLADARVHDSGL